MKKISLVILLFLGGFLLTGCASGLFLMNKGTAKFSIPFDFPKK